MKQKKLLKILIIAIFILPGGIYLSCSNPAGPGEETSPGRRDYVWTADTLNSPMNDLSSIWGSSPTNVWTVGPGGDANNRLFHFNGTKWEKWKEPINCATNTIYGFTANNVWMGGDGYIWHFDGTNWTQSYLYNPANAHSVDIEDIWGKSSNDLYAVGVTFYDSQNTQRGFILHYDGTKWSEFYKADFYSQFQRIRAEDNNIYVQAIKVGYTVSDTTEFYQLSGNNLVKIYSESRDKIYAANLNMIGDNVYFTIGRDVYRYEDESPGIKKFSKKLTISNSNFDYLVSGRNIKDLFIFMLDGVAHYNGSDIEYLYKLKSGNRLWIGYMIFNKEIFFNVYDLSDKANYILMGKLK